MNAPFDTEALHAVLDRATEHIESPHLTVAALAGARRVRARRRMAAAGVAALAVVAAFGIIQVVGDPKTEPPVAPPTPTPTDLVAPEISADVVQPEWDPRTAASLPEEDLSSYANRTMLVDDGEDLEVRLTGGGEPVTIAYPEAGYGPEGQASSTISGSGMVLAYTGKTGLWWRDFRDEDQAEWHRVDYPSDFIHEAAYPWPSLIFGDDDTLYVLAVGLTWVVDLSSGESERLGLVALSLHPATTPDGSLVAAAYHRTSDTQTIQELDGAEVVRTADSASLGWLESLSVNSDSIAAVHGTGNDVRARRDGLVALDRDTLEATAFLPILDPDILYESSGVATLAWLDESTVLLQVSTIDDIGRDPRSHLVTWNVDTGHLARVEELSWHERVRMSVAP